MCPGLRCERGYHGDTLGDKLRWMLIATTLLLICPQKASADVSCNEAYTALLAMPELEVLDQLHSGAARFVYKRGGGLNLTCAVSVDLVIGVSPLPQGDFWPFFGRLAQVVGVEPAEAIKAAQACRANAETHQVSERAVRGEPIDTDTLHVDCRVSKTFLSLGIFRPPQ
jgi:hypothetical protein